MNERVIEAFNALKHHVDGMDGPPQTGIILGSGLGELLDDIENAVRVRYADIPHFPQSSVDGHRGEVLFGNLGGNRLFVLSGRIHYYEGYSMPEIGLPVRVMQRLGIEVFIVTNAAGGVNPDYVPGDVMLITDHINLVGMGGASPLRGPNLDELGPRFPDMGQPYDRQLADLARDVATGAGIALQEGVYVSLAGPSFESPADLRFLRAIGVDAVGMSTVPEVITARHGGTKVLGFSGISNKANLDGNTLTTHEEVLEAGDIIVPKLLKIVRTVLSRL